MDIGIISSIFLLPLLLAAGVAWAASPLIIRLYTKMGWLDDPQTKKHKKIVHTYAVPRGGGVVVFVALLLGVSIFLGIDKHTAGILLGAFILMIIGLIDDVMDMSPYWRLFWGGVAALTVIGAGIGIAFITNPLNGGIIPLNEPQIPIWFWGKERTIWILADLFAFLWISWCMNMVNWSKGLDGQLPGTVLVAATIIAFLSFRFTEDVTQWQVSTLAAITAGAYLGFLPWNVFPQKMMPGYGGGSIAGYLLAVLSILSGAKLATLMLVLGIPMIDALYVMARRLWKKKSPVWGDRSHFHHLLLDLGWSKQQVAWFYWLITLGLGLLALQLNARQKLFTIVLLALLFGAVLLWVNYFIRSSKQLDRANG